MDAERAQRLEHLYHSALEHEAAERDDFLKSACGDDAALRRELESLLAHDREAGDFLETPALEVAARLLPQQKNRSDEDSDATLVGQTVSHYRIIEKLGRGGMGVVYAARDTTLGRSAALKFLPQGFAHNATAVGRFRREARAASALDHPNICTVYEFGEHEGQPFIAMALLHGQTLRNRLELRAAAFTPTELMNLAIQIADGLGAAHEKGIIHRDIKPANIFITTREEVKILDFGLAKLSDAVDREDSRPDSIQSSVSDLGLSRAGVRMGTVPYMSPEQVRGEKLDARTDLFSFGLLIYEMATGKPAFCQNTAAELQDAILNHAPIAARELNPALPRQLEEIIKKSLEKDRCLRYQKAAAMRAELQRLMRDTGYGFHGADAAAWQTRVIVGALLVLFAVGLGIFIARIPRRPVLGPVERTMVEGGRRSVAVLGFRNLSANPEQEWVSTALSEILSTELASGDKLRVIAGENVAHMKSDLSLPVTDSYAPETLAKIRGSLGADDVVVGSYLALGKGTRSPLHINLRLQDASGGETIAAIAENGSEADLAELVSRASATLRTKLGMGVISEDEAQHVGASLPLNPEAVRFYSRGLAKLRAFDAKAACELFEKAVALDPNHSLSHSFLAQSLFSLGYEEKAKDEARKAVELSQNLPRRDRLLVEARYRELQNDYLAAIEVYRTLWTLFPDDVDNGLGLAAAQVKAGKGKDSLATIAQLRKLPGPQNQDPRIDLAESEANESLGNFESAQREASVAADLASRQGSRLLMAAAKGREAWDWDRLGEFDKAGAEFTEVRNLSLQSGNPASAASALNGAANVLYDKGDFEGALKSYLQALEIVRQIGAERMIAVVAMNIGNIFADRGKLSEARRYYLEALDIDRALGSKDVASDLANLANVARSMGDLPGAVRMQEQSIEASRQQGDRLGEGETLIDMGYVLVEEGQLAAAKARFEEGMAILQQVGFRSGRGFALFGISGVLLPQDRVTEARAKTEEAIALFKELGDTNHLAQCQLQLVRILLEQGNAPEAARAARDVAAEFEKKNMSDFGCAAQAVLSEAFLAQAKVQEARAAANRGTELCRLGSDRTSQFQAQFALAAVRNRTGNVNDAFKILETVRAEATRYGYLGYVLESRLRLGELELASGNLSAGRVHLAQLESDARSRGFGLIARKSEQASRSH